MLAFRISKLLYALALILAALPGAFVRRNRIRQVRRHENMEKPISVVVNGPSLDLSQISEDSNIFCVNQICLSDEFEKLRPRYYMFLDPRYAETSSPNSSFYKAVEGLNARTSWNLVLFIPQHFKKSIQSRIDNQNIQICAYPLTPFPAIELPTPMRPILYNTALMTPPASNVLVHALYIAIHLRFKKISLHGADMNFFQGVYRSQNGALVFQQKHFYGVEEIPLGISMARFLQEQYQSFSAYKDLSVTASRCGARISNHSPKSMIDAFEIVGKTSHLSATDMSIQSAPAAQV